MLWSTSGYQYLYVSFILNQRSKCSRGEFVRAIGSKTRAVLIKLLLNVNEFPTKKFPQLSCQNLFRFNCHPDHPQLDVLSISLSSSADSRRQKYAWL
jgi:hypothetical protein